MPSLLQPLRKAYRALLDLRDEAVFARLSQPRPVLRSRHEFPLWLNLLNLRGQGVEIGVQRGTYSTVLLSTWAGQHLTCIDPWRSFDPASYHDTANVEQSRQDANFETTRQRLAPFGTRASQLRQAAVACYPSHLETFGIAPVEAMAMGKVTVYADCGPAREVITPGHDGFLCPVAQPEALATVLLEALALPAEQRHRLGENARATVLQRFDRPVVASQMAEFLRRVATAGKAGTTN